jgi:DNA-binding protein HU-beta
MNKNHLIRIASRRCCGKKEARLVVDEVCETMANALANGEKVVLSGFGAFHVYERKPRRGVHPRNPKKEIQIPAMKSIRFVPGKELRGKLN